MTKFSEFLAANTGSAGNGEVEFYTENQVLRAYDWDEDRIRAIRLSKCHLIARILSSSQS